MKIIDGKETANQIKAEIKAEVDALYEQTGKKPLLACIVVGNNPASASYVKNKIKSCDECGFESWVTRLDDNVSEDRLLREIEDLNNDNRCDGFIVQLPLPSHIDEKKVIAAISPNKDVDGFTPVNVGKMVLGEDCFISATPLGITELLKRNNIETTGKHCVVVGRSNIVGKPMVNLMLQKAMNCTVTVVHTGTSNIADYTKQADILIVASGKPNTITADMIKEGVTIIDVGINRIEDSSKTTGFRLVGDVDFEGCKDKCNAITPVPGGVGPMTVCSLMMNTLKAFKQRNC